MANTGVSVNDEVISEFNEVKLGRKKATFLTYKIEGGNIVTDVFSTSESFEDFLNALPADDCRYAIYDKNFTTTDGRPGNKLVFIAWYDRLFQMLYFLVKIFFSRSPDCAKVKAKMVYAGSKDALTRAFVGVSAKITATDRSELTEDIVVDACRKFN